MKVPMKNFLSTFSISSLLLSHLIAWPHLQPHLTAKPQIPSYLSPDSTSATDSPQSPAQRRP
uniref:Uncharacterized protein n=1 Tax=Callorhinchus milii TaxID=7868 RepID=A0A4W3IMB6_CALMI